MYDRTRSRSGFVVQENTVPFVTRLIPAILIGLIGVSAVLLALIILGHGQLPPVTQFGIQSATVAAGRSPYMMYWALAFGLATTVLAALICAGTKNHFSRDHSLARLIFVLLITVWVLNTIRCSQATPFGLSDDPVRKGEYFVDSFHEGEYLAYRDAYREGGLASCLVIHGPVLNILPALVAGPYTDSGYSIAIARLCRSLFCLASILGFLWTIWELGQYYSSGSMNSILRLLAISGIALEGWLYQNTFGWRGNGPFRDAAFYIPLALLLRWLRPERAAALRDFVYGILLGALTIVGLLVSYERGASWPIVFVLGAVLGTVVRGWASGLRMVTGACVGAVAVSAVVGGNVLTVILGQVSYWARYGDVMFAQVPVWQQLIYSPYFVGQLLAIFGIMSWIIGDFFARQVDVRKWLEDMAPLLLMLLVSGLTERRVLARGDPAHYQLAGMPIILTLAALILLIDRRLAKSGGRSWLAPIGEYIDRPIVMTTIAVFFVLTHQNCFPLGPASFLIDWAPNRVRVTAQTQEIATAVARHGPFGPGEFYPLDSEGMWYHLLGVSSPSRFHLLVYAMPAASQEEVIRDLEKHQTRVILVPPASCRLDGIPMAEMFPLVQSYIRAHYSKAEVVGDYEILTRDAVGQRKD
jgi:hypothetical protein